ncbi:conserved hypothetical protein [Culex quinquefasciatus]|uniref:Heparan-alpha-glucosaminide N-acetyltransferase catalytic domain-containing protein n=1 Tax=Culex quinquefasciatus TaxID=7176 RepID=B0VZ46_CULQU|nr:conserved hypothetical protein [Culex quinquefasciatus]|eukprot:XP_001841731.1 conserved hypothetical protein [Culex quinquefasciatus]
MKFKNNKYLTNPPWLRAYQTRISFVYSLHTTYHQTRFACAKSVSRQTSIAGRVVFWLCFRFRAFDVCCFRLLSHYLVGLLAVVWLTRTNGCQSRSCRSLARMIEYTERYFRGLDLWSLGVDEAFINATVRGSQNYYLYSLSDECERCPYTRVQEIKGGANPPVVNNVFKLGIARKLSLKVLDRNVGKYAFDNESFVCQFSDQNLGEFGVYDIGIEEGNRVACTLETAKEPVNIYLPFITIALIAAALYVLFKLLQHGVHLVQRSRTPSEPQLSPNSPTISVQATGVPQKTRLRSLDTFRGIAIMLMIFVNSGGGDYWWIEHATWNGLHVADLVFPWFLFIMGVCIPISLRSQLGRNVPRYEILKNVAVRSLKLFLIGLCLNSINGPTVADLRLFGVLQRFGVAYFVVSAIHLYCYQENDQLQHPLARSHADILRLWKHWVIVGTIVFVYLLVIFFVPVPNCPSGYFGPGGKHLMLLYPNCTGGITGYIDRQVLGIRHLYQHPTARYMYDAMPFDPEGPFGCLPTIFQLNSKISVVQPSGIVLMLMLILVKQMRRMKLM